MIDLCLNGLLHLVESDAIIQLIALAFACTIFIWPFSFGISESIAVKSDRAGKMCPGSKLFPPPKLFHWFNAPARRSDISCRLMQSFATEWTEPRQGASNASNASNVVVASITAVNHNRTDCIRNRSGTILAAKRTSTSRWSTRRYATLTNTWAIRHGLSSRR